MTSTIEQIFGVVKTMLLATILFLFSTSTHAQGYQVKTIVIDAGHGGRDPGALGKVGKEKDINLKVALMTGSYIEKYLPDVKVIYTRTTDEFVDLKKRPEIANKNKADLFISIHVNAVPNSRVTGASTWLLGVSKNQANLEIAKLENSVIELEDNYKESYKGFDPNKDESYIIFSFNATKAYFDQSLSLAQELQNQFSNRVGRKNYGIQQAEFWVLLQTTMPSVLIELGFITNPTEEKFLLSNEGQEYMASAIFRSVRDYKTQIEAKNKVPVAPVRVDETNDIAKPMAIETTSHGITFRVQFLLVKRILEPDDAVFRGLSDVWRYQDGEYYKYTAGSSSNITDIQNVLESMRDTYPDAFIAAFKDGKRISIAEAKRIISQSGN